MATDYVAYFPQGSGADAWGVAVSAAGHTRIRPGTPYPPNNHPRDHALSWERGRVLHQFQLIYISHGSGRFESKAGGRRRITAGSVFLLFPGVWHRYQPDPAVGWVEDWIELTGATMNRLRAAKVISPARAVLRVGLRPELLDLFDRCQRTFREPPPRQQSVFGTLGLQILAQCISLASSRDRKPSAADTAVRRGQAIITGAVDRPLRMERLAEEVGMSYSYFRRAFKQRTSVTPKQYHLQLRLRRAMELLTHSSASVKEIAQTLGFDSAFHLSADFKARTGMAPTQWRSAANKAGASSPRARGRGRTGSFRA